MGSSGKQALVRRRERTSLKAPAREATKRSEGLHIFSPAKCYLKSFSKDGKV